MTINTNSYWENKLLREKSKVDTLIEQGVERTDPKMIDAMFDLYTIVNFLYGAKRMQSLKA